MARTSFFDRMKMMAVRALGRASVGTRDVAEVPIEAERVVPTSAQSVRFACGHEGPKSWMVHLWGVRLLPPDKLIPPGTNECPDCQFGRLKEFAIRCCLCGVCIGPGDPIALYAGPISHFKKWTRWHEGQGIGCLGYDCCPSGGFMAGHWDGKDVRPLFDDGATVVARAFQTGGAVIGNMNGDGSVSIVEIPRHDQPKSD